MLPLALLAAAALGWLWYKGRLGPQLWKRAAQIGIGLLLSWLAARGQWAGAAALGVALLFVEFSGRFGGRNAASAPGMVEEEALRILGLAHGATPAEIRAAHRRLIAQVHPDRGGTAELAHQINKARDSLLKR